MTVVYKVVLILALIVCVASVKAVIKIFTDKVSYEDPVQNTYTREIGALNKTLPKSIGPNMVLMSASIESSSIVYEYKMATSIHDLDYVEFKEERAAILKESCDEISIIETLGDGFEFRFRYFDVNGNHLVSVPLTRKICASSK